MVWLIARTINGDLPASFKNKGLLVLDLGALIAGTKYPGEFQERLKAVLSEFEAAAGVVVLSIDKLHTLVGVGAAKGSMEA